MIYALFRAAVRLVALIILGGRLRIEGMKHLPRRGGALVVGNHVGAVDPVLTGIHIPRLDVYYMGKSELFRHRLLGWLFRQNHVFPVVRDSPDRTALRTALTLLDSGHVLLVYPEGTRSEDGRMGAPLPGAGFIARHVRVPIVPVASWGSDKVIPKGVHFPRRADVHIRVGEPFSLPAAGAAGKALSNVEAAAYMMAKVAALLPEGMRPGVAGGAMSGASPAA
jgi:1-acyl-sn-glycerol-3-phosphate acyltransferase